MNTCSRISIPTSRRGFLQATSAGFGWLAFSALAQAAASNPLAPKPPHFAAKAKRVIFLYMQGGPSHIDTFDWKPEYAKIVPKGHHQPFGPVFKYEPRGLSGLMISDAFPKLAATHADELCLLNSMKTSTASHAQATVALHTGAENFVRPSMGAWITYGLGSLAEDLPGFVTLDPPHDQGGAMNYGSAFLPASFQGTPIGGVSRGVPNLEGRLSDSTQQKQLEFIQKLNRRTLAADPTHPELEGVIHSYELAYRMQMSIPSVLAVDGESAATQELYGLNNGTTERFGRQCLLARRLAEKGVRFIQITSNGWDHHNKLREGLGDRAAGIDQPITGLLTDLKQRGMLQETLVLWGGEFGRGAADDKGDGNGRGHNNRGYTMWMAGGGVKGGMRHGSTDELGDTAVQDVMKTQDLHATLLHLLGLDHELLTYRYAGRDFRLTNVSGRVAKAIVA